MGEQRSPINVELISAYLDEELSEEDRAQVERLLESHNDLQSLLDDLRAIRLSLKSLPRHQLGDDLSQRVLRQAEREMLGKPPVSVLADEDPDVAPESATDPISEDPPVATVHPDRGGAWRGVIWAVAAVAAAVLLVIFIPPAEQEQVAMQDMKETDGPTIALKQEAAASSDTSESPPSAYGVAAGNRTTGEPVDAGLKLNGAVRIDAEEESYRYTQADVTNRMDSRELQERPDWVITVNASRQALNTRSFDDSLAMNDIHFGDESVDAIAAADAPDEDVASLEPPVSEVDKYSSLYKSVEPEVQLIYVEASRSQINGALAQLENLDGQFPEIRVEQFDEFNEFNQEMDGRRKSGQKFSVPGRAARPDYDSKKKREEQPIPDPKDLSRPQRETRRRPPVARGTIRDTVSKPSRGPIQLHRIPESFERSNDPRTPAAVDNERSQVALHGIDSPRSSGRAWRLRERDRQSAMSGIAAARESTEGIKTDSFSFRTRRKEPLAKDRNLSSGVAMDRPLGAATRVDVDVEQPVSVLFVLRVTDPTSDAATSVRSSTDR